MIAALLLAQALNWTSGAVQSSVWIDTGSLHYKESAVIPQLKATAWTEYWIALSDIQCLQLAHAGPGSVLRIRGDQSDSVQKLARQSNSQTGYRRAVGSFEIDFPVDSAHQAQSVVNVITAAQPQLARTLNKGACAGV